MIVTGVPGSGKSTVVGKALGELKKENVEYTIVNYGDVMLELMEKMDGITHRDEMRKIPTQRYREIQREAGRRIAQAAKKGNVLVDTHCLVKKPEGYYPGLPIWVLEELKPDLLLIVEAAPEEISRRRLKDADRKRDVEVQLEIEEHQSLNRATAMAYVALTGAAVRIIQNRDKRLDEAVEEMISALR